MGYEMFDKKMSNFDDFCDCFYSVMDFDRGLGEFVKLKIGIEVVYIVIDIVINFYLDYGYYYVIKGDFYCL